MATNNLNSSHMIIVTLPGALKPGKIKELARKGYVHIESTDPSKVVVIESKPLESDISMAAIHALTTISPVSRADQFVNTLWNRLKKQDLPPTKS